MRVQIAGLVLLCILAACERKPAATAAQGLPVAAKPAPILAGGKHEGRGLGGFIDAWTLDGGAMPPEPQQAAPAVDPRRAMENRIAKFRAARERARLNAQPPGPAARQEPGTRPGDLVGLRAGDQALRQAPQAGESLWGAPRPALGAAGRAAYDSAMNSRIERFRMAQLSRGGGAVPNPPVAVHGISASAGSGAPVPMQPARH
jgi:hypothetical protein